MLFGFPISVIRVNQWSDFGFLRVSAVNALSDPSWFSDAGDVARLSPIPLNPSSPVRVPDQESPALLTACGRDQSLPVRVRCSTDVWQRTPLSSMWGRGRVQEPVRRQRWAEK